MAASWGHALQVSSVPRGAFNGGKCVATVSVSTGILEDGSKLSRFADVSEAQAEREALREILSVAKDLLEPCVR